MKRQAILLGSVLVLWATVPANGDLINGGFDTGNLFGWTSSGPVTVDAIGGTPPAAVLGEDEFLFDGTDLHRFSKSQPVRSQPCHLLLPCLLRVISRSLSLRTPFLFPYSIRER